MLRGAVDIQSHANFAEVMASPDASEDVTRMKLEIQQSVDKWLCDFETSIMDATQRIAHSARERKLFGYLADLSVSFLRAGWEALSYLTLVTR